MSAVPGRRRGGLGLGLLFTAALAAGCVSDPPQTGPETSASPTGTPVTITAGQRPQDSVLAHVLVRHLHQRGIPAEVGEASPAPWAAAEGTQAAVVDTLLMAVQTEPEELAGPVPSPSPTTSPSPGSATAEAGASPSPGTGPPTGARSPSPEPTEYPYPTPSPSPLPDGEPAPDADATLELVEPQFPEDSEVVAGSPGTLRLQAVTTAATAELFGLDELTDLQGRCGALNFIATPAAQLSAERLEVLAGCEPGEWVEPTERGPARDVVAGEAAVGLLYGTNPTIEDHELRRLADPDRLLPEGRMVTLADPEELPDGAAEAIGEVIDRLDGTQLTQLRRLATEPNALEGPEAAQYWLVNQGLEEAPEGWF